MSEKRVCMDIIDRQKVNRIVEFIRACGNFAYDADDVIEGLNEILLGYGIYDFLAGDEFYLLMDELLDLAEKSEISEAVRWASLELVCGHDSVSDYRIPGRISAFHGGGQIV